MKLSELKEGEKGVIVEIDARERDRRRLLSLGFRIGGEVKVVRVGRSGAVAVETQGCLFAMRRSAASVVEVRGENSSRR